MNKPFDFITGRKERASRRHPDGRKKALTCLVLMVTMFFSACAAVPAEDGTLHGGEPQQCKKPAPQTHLERYSFSERHMGVEMSIILYADSESRAKAASKAAFERIAELEQILSDYRRDSEVRVLCREYKANVPHKVSPDLFRILKKSGALYSATTGMFNPDIGIAVQLWRRARRTGQLPDKEKLKAASGSVTFLFIEFDEQNSTVTFPYENLRLDFGGIGKGFAADEALKVLKTNGVPRALLNLGGDAVAGDPPPGKKGWTVGLSTLKDREGKLLGTIELANKAAATSGDAWQFVVIDGVRYSHILHPDTGLGVTHQCSATAIAKDGATADAMATALCIIKPQLLPVRPGSRYFSSGPFLVLTEEDGKVAMYKSALFPKITYSKEMAKVVKFPRILQPSPSDVYRTEIKPEDEQRLKLRPGAPSVE